MGYGHRKDTLTDAMNVFSFWKGVNEAVRLVNSFEKAVETLKSKRTTLANLEGALGEDTMKELVEEKEGAGGAQYRPHKRRLQNWQVADQMGVHEEFGKDDRKCWDQYGVGIRDETNLRTKLKERGNPTTRQALENNETTRKMRKMLESWFKTLGEFMPPEALQEPLDSHTQPEKELLQFSSDFDWKSHEHLGLVGLAASEFLLRQGQAHDALKKLRQVLGLKAFLAQVEKWAEVYQQSWKAMGRLREKGADGNHGRGRLEALTAGDLIMLSEWMDDHRLWREQGEIVEAAAAKKGKGCKELPWLWKLEFEANTSRDKVAEAVEKMMAEAICIEWLHTKASVERFEEEVKLLLAEISRVPRIFVHYEKPVGKERKTLVTNLSPFIPQFFKPQLDQLLPYCDNVIVDESEAEAYAIAQGLPKPKNIVAVAKAIAALPKINASKPRIVMAECDSPQMCRGAA
ncbi:hypothetical protein M422DRAFT_257526 [Sphaerobolus stellatus SS14]|uniref:Uncharacterized protein n=1 Tax=Sphaerobolus stellatus (strain SS14) TaxID=990650 RepID=A0A0C9VPC2_SPHS4|nr:hypothetical protein M422DRAFT_257526 [Sphaerobolus stellatus SS14]